MIIEELMALANEVKAHARSQIKKGYTQIQNNNLTDVEYAALNKGVDDVREEILAKSKNLHKLEDDITHAYEERIALTSKYSLGNCQELAQHALDYILTHGVPIRAEVFEVIRGDHAILVMNRSRNSIPDDPTTWGDDAIICDPWADKVYKANDFESELKCLFSIEKKGRVKNYPVNFDYKKFGHRLEPMVGLDTDYLAKQRNLMRLKENFHKESQKLLSIFDEYVSKLNSALKNLTGTREANDWKVSQLSNKVTQFKKMMNDYRRNVELLMKDDFNNDYRIARENIIPIYKNFYHEITKNIAHPIEEFFLETKVSKNPLALFISTSAAERELVKATEGLRLSLKK